MPHVSRSALLHMAFKHSAAATDRSYCQDDKKAVFFEVVAKLEASAARAPRSPVSYEELTEDEAETVAKRARTAPPLAPHEPSAHDLCLLHQSAAAAAIAAHNAYNAIVQLRSPLVQWVHAKLVACGANPSLCDSVNCRFCQVDCGITLSAFCDTNYEGTLYMRYNICYDCAVERSNGAIRQPLMALFDADDACYNLSRAKDKSDKADSKLRAAFVAGCDK